MDEVRRQEDDELCGHVERCDGHWCALTVFGAVLGHHDDRCAAIDEVLAIGLSSLSRRWTLRHGESRDEEVVCIQEAHPGAVTVARGYYSLPGVPTLTITADQLATGEWQLRL
jgi:hypothetical protein